MVIAAQSPMLSIRADVFKLCRRRAEKIRLGAWRMVDAQKNFALQSLQQRRLRPRKIVRSEELGVRS